MCGHYGCDGVDAVSVLTLDAAGWATMERAHAETPTLLAQGAIT